LHFAASVERPLDPRTLDAWMTAAAASTIRRRITNRLAPWGLRDNTRDLPGSSDKPIIWDRITEGTLALFSNRDEYFCQAQVVGKTLSEQASADLWGSPEFRWVLLLSDVHDVSIPLTVVRQGAGFSASYTLNRQAIVPRAVREATLWQAISGLVASPPAPTVVELVPPEGVATEAYEVSPTEQREARRRESELVAALRAWWSDRDGSDAVWRLAITPSGSERGSRPIYSIAPRKNWSRPRRLQIAGPFAWRLGNWLITDASSTIRSVANYFSPGSQLPTSSTSSRTKA
jgi:hypothetical protein